MSYVEGIKLLLEASLHFLKGLSVSIAFVSVIMFTCMLMLSFLEDRLKKSNKKVKRVRRVKVK